MQSVGFWLLIGTRKFAEERRHIMRAEIETMASEIKQSVELLRRHL